MATPTYGPRDWSSEPFVVPAQKSAVRRGPSRPLVPLWPSLSELTGPAHGHDCVEELDHDLTRTRSRKASRWASS
jgi:protocatechuate 3,4-dioxygenase, beta subunit